MAVESFEADAAGGLRPLGSAPSFAGAAALLPAGAYTTLRTFGGHRVLDLARHVRRLEESAALIGQPGALPQERVRAAIAATLRASGHPESRLRLTWAPPRLGVSVEPFAPLPEAVYEQGVRCVTLPALHRDNPHAKDTRFLATAIGAYRTLPPGTEEGLLLGADGAVLEGLSSNFFAVVDGILRTEEEQALIGVTRAEVLELAAELIACRGGAPRLVELANASECFITSVSRGILPVVAIDARPVADGRPGPVARELRRLHLAAAEAHARSVLSHGSAAGAGEPASE